MLKRNLIANYFGQGWSALMGLAFVPMYIKYIGIEAYGLIGLFAILQACLVLLDMGMTPTLSREMGRFSGGARTSDSILDLLRSVETIAIGLALLIALGVIAVSDWVANHWLQVEGMPLATVRQAFCIMGFVAALRFLEAIYRSCLLGLQQQVLFNVVNSAMATFRGLGAVVVLAYVSPTIEAFFIWQGAISITTLILLLISTYRSLPGADRRGRFSIKEVKGISRYATGMIGITFLTLLLTQIDKILLSKLLALSEYGYYTLAAVLAGGLYMLLVPIVQAWFPRLSQLHASNNDTAFIETYHEGAQLVSVIVGSAALVLITFTDTILLLWTRNPELTRSIAVVVKWLALGNMLNGLMTIPYQAQLAYGWTGYAIRVNTIAVILIVPALFFAIPLFGMLGAAIVWVLLNVGYIVFGIHFMHKTILPKEKWRWYREDIVKPMLPALLMSVILFLLVPEFESPIHQILIILMSFFLIFASAVFGSPKIYQRARKGLLLPVQATIWGGKER